MSQQQLATILESGATKGCLAFFARLSEKERQAYSQQVLAWLKKVVANRFIETKPGTFSVNPLLEAAKAAVLASCSLSQLKNLAHGALPTHEMAFEILSVRRPDWLDDWAEWICDLIPQWWPLIRQFMKAGLCRKPATESYVLGMIVGVCYYHENKKTIYDALVADPDLLEEDLWRLFEVEGDKELTVAARDKYSRGENSWTYALVRLANEKTLPRARLLDASLDALQRDFGQFHAGWFSQFHEALEPTLSERAERCERYLGLLASRIPPTVSFALRSLQALAKEDKVDGLALFGAIGPALWSKHKGTVALALQLLEQTTRKHPELAARIGPVVAEAFHHESPEVHALAVKLLEKYAQTISAEAAELLRARLPDIAASQRPRLQKLLAGVGAVPVESEMSRQRSDGAEQAGVLRQRAAKLDRKWRRLAGVDVALSALERDSCDLPAIDFDPMAIPRLDPGKRIEPLANLDALIDAYVHILEDPSDPMEVERVLDGVARFCGQKPADFAARVGPLRKRALDRLGRMFAGPFIGCGVLVDLCGVARAWLCGEVVLPEKEGPQRYDKTLHVYTYENPKNDVEFLVYHKPTARTFLSLRALALARRSVAGPSAPLLATPTHAPGWIDPRELVRRALAVAALGVEDRIDQIQALLRLAPDQRGAALKAAKKVGGEFGRALRYALGGDEKIGADAALWIAAARARDPFADDDRLEKKHKGLGPDAGRAACYQAEVRKRRDGDFRFLTVNVEPKPPSTALPEAITVLLNPHPKSANEYNHSEVRADVPDLRWAASIWPAQRESWFARAAPLFANNLDWWEAEWANYTFLEPLLDPDVPLRPMALLMLALGLAAKDAGESGLAMDALIAAIEDGRLDGAKFGQALASLAPTGLVKLSRWARTLGQAARISPLHCQVIARAIQGALSGDAKDLPKDLHTLLELLKETLIELGGAVASADARSFLEKVKVSGKTARLVNDLLALTEAPETPNREAGLLRALEHRLDRAERWAGRTEDL